MGVCLPNKIEITERVVKWEDWSWETTPAGVAYSGELPLFVFTHNVLWGGYIDS